MVIGVVGREGYVFFVGDVDSVICVGIFVGFFCFGFVVVIWLVGVFIDGKVYFFFIGNVYCIGDGVVEVRWFLF